MNNIIIPSPPKCRSSFSFECSLFMMWATGYLACFTLVRLRWALNPKEDGAPFLLDSQSVD